MPSFTIPIQARKVKTHQVTSLHLFALLLLLGASVVLAFMSGWGMEKDGLFEKFGNPFFYIACTIGGLSLLLLVVLLVKNKSITSLGPLNVVMRLIELALLVFYWLMLLDKGNMPLLILFAVPIVGLVLALVLERKGGALSVLINDEGVTLSSGLFPKKMNWAAINNIMLRHGTLSIEGSDNQFYQWFTTAKDADGSLEAFATLKIEAHRAQRIADW